MTRVCGDLNRSISELRSYVDKQSIKDTSAINKNIGNIKDEIRNIENTILNHMDNQTKIIEEIKQPKSIKFHIERDKRGKLDSVVVEEVV